MTPRPFALLLALVALAAGLPAAAAGEGEQDEADAWDEVATAASHSSEEGSSEEKDEEDHEDEDDEEWEDESRDVQLRTGEGGFEYESRRESELADDEIRARFDGERSSFRFDYKAEGPNATELTFRVDFVALLEHEDADANGAYDVGERVLRRVELEGTRPSVRAQQQGSLQVIDVTYAVPGGALTLRFHVAAQETVVGGVNVTPTQAKYDVLVTGYAWTSPTARLALETRTRTTLEAEFDPDDEGEPGIEFARGDIAGFYRWVNDTLIDGRIEPVGATVLAQRTSAAEEGYDHESVVVFSYAHGARITHDPSFGVERLEEAIGRIVSAIQGDWRVFTAALAVTAAALLATALPRMRRRG